MDMALPFLRFNRRFAEQRHEAGWRMCRTGGSGEGRLFPGASLNPKSRPAAHPTRNRRHCGACERGAVWRKTINMEFRQDEASLPRLGSIVERVGWLDRLNSGCEARDMP